MVAERYASSGRYYLCSVSERKAVQKYIQNQETEDMITDQISMVECYDPFKQWIDNNKKRINRKE